jgi:Fur family ferric uptake transcriptional regulator
MADCTRIRRSKQREIILEELKKFDSHPSADELYERVRKRLPHISLGTVYRNLEILAREGIIQRIATSDASAADGSTTFRRAAPSIPANGNS